MPPDVLIVIPVLDRERLIGPCLDSVLASRYPAEQVHVVVVDNGSTDGTAAVLERYRGRVTLLAEARRGPAAARNRGWKARAAEVVAFTDSDCEVHEDWLQNLVTALVKRDLGAAGGRILAFPEGNNIEHFGERIHDHRKALSYFDPPYTITMNLAVRHRDLSDLGGFDEDLPRCSDVEFSRRMLRADRPLGYVHDAVVFHRNESSLLGLANEGFVHGYHGARLAHLERSRVEAGLVSAVPHRLTPAAPPPEEYTRHLPRLEEAFYRAMFTAAKRVGAGLERVRRPRRSVDRRLSPP